MVQLELSWRVTFAPGPDTVSPAEADSLVTGWLAEPSASAVVTCEVVGKDRVSETGPPDVGAPPAVTSRLPPASQYPALPATVRLTVWVPASIPANGVRSSR